MSEIEEHNLGEEPVRWQDHDWTLAESKFAAEYLRTGRCSAAYRTAYPDRVKDRASQNVSTSASTLLHKGWMQDYIKCQREIIMERLKEGPDNVLAELRKIGFANMADFTVMQADGTPQFDLSAVTHEQMAGVSELTIDTYWAGKGEDAREVKSVKMKLASKHPALELIGKHYKLFTDVVETKEVGDVAEEMRLAREARRRRKEQPNEGEENAETDD